MITTARARERSYAGILTITTNLTKGGTGVGTEAPPSLAPLWPRPGAFRAGDDQRPSRPFSGSGRAVRGRDCTTLHHPQERYGPSR